MIGSFSDVLLAAISLFLAPHFGLVIPFTVIGEGDEHVRGLAMRCPTVGSIAPFRVGPLSRAHRPTIIQYVVHAPGRSQR